MPRALLVFLLASGCATSLSGFQPAHVAPKGHVTAEAGFDVSVPTGTITKAIDAGKTLANYDDKIVAPFLQKIVTGLARTLAQNTVSQPPQMQLPVLK